MSDAGLELLLACLETELAERSPKRRLRFLRALLWRLEASQAPGRVTALRSRSDPEGLALAHKALRERLPKLMAP